MNELNTLATQPRQLARAMRELATAPAPDSLLPSVLIAAGIADVYFLWETPLGKAYVAYNQLGISCVSMARSRVEFEEQFEQEFGRQAFFSETPQALKSKLEAKLERDVRQDLAFDLRSVSPFQQSVLYKTLEIPRGEVRPYAWVAREIGHPKAVRAVGTALARNPVPLLIPCHRVVRTGGQIGSYGMGGPAKKLRLLEWEGALPSASAASM